MGTTVQDLRYAQEPGIHGYRRTHIGPGHRHKHHDVCLVSAIVLRRPPSREPERVAVVISSTPAQGFQADASPLSVPNYLAWREANHVFAGVAATDEYRTVSLSSEHESGALRAAAVSPNYFSVLSVTPQLGRTFQAGEDQIGQDHVVILSHELWERRFGSDASLLGRTIRLNREPCTVIGVMPASFRLLGFTPHLWTPLVLTAADQTAAARRDRSLFVFARLKPGATKQEANGEEADPYSGGDRFCGGVANMNDIWKPGICYGGGGRGRSRRGL